MVSAVIASAWVRSLSLSRIPTVTCVGIAEPSWTGVAGTRVARYVSLRSSRRRRSVVVVAGVSSPSSDSGTTSAVAFTPA